MRIVLFILAVTATAHADQTPVTSFGSNPGGLQMYEHVPANLPSRAPLVVVLHGCTQTASSMESAGWDTLADKYGFAVLYPQQTSTGNPVECFNWAGEYGNLADITRGQGENESIIQMVDTMISAHGLDAKRVYVTGFSAGAAFTTVMLATWPDRFAAGSIMEGIAYECATSVSGAYMCQSPGVTQTPAQWGDLVRAAGSGYAGPWPRVQVWAGTSDTTVVPANATELIKQWTNVWGTDQTADSTEMLGSNSHSTYLAGSTVAVDAYTVSGMDHAVALGTDSIGACPGSTAQYFEDHAICSTLRAAQFFGVIPGGVVSGSGSGTSGTGSDGGDGGDGNNDNGSAGTCSHDMGGCSVDGGGGSAVIGVVALALLRSRRRR
jgi:poly(hydroxyalkanoate) depolymerase family esterase